MPDSRVSSFRRKCAKRVALAITGVVLYAPHAEAALLVYSQLFVEVGVFPGPYDSTFPEAPATTLGPVQLDLDNGLGASASAVGLVDNGVPKVSVSKTGAGYALAQARFFDTILLTSATLPIGTPVTFSSALSPSYALTGDFSGECIPEGQPPVIATGEFMDQSLNAIGPRLIFNDECGTITGTYANVFDGLIGQEIILDLAITLFVGQVSPGPLSIDAMSSLNIFVDPLGDFSYTTASGNTYFSTSVVPEPSTWLLLVGGLAVLIASRWSRKRSGIW